jgi:D-alanine transaminase
MKELAYYDGKIGTPDELTVPFNDRVHFFGDGVYDATVGGNHRVFLLQDHLDRFYSSAKSLDIRIPMEKKALGELLTDLLARVEGSTHFVYWQVTRGVGARNHVYDEDMAGKLWVMIRPNRLNDPDKPIRLATAEDTRFYHCNIKTLNLLPSVLAAQEAKRLSVDETVFHRGPVVTECAHSNVSILKNGVFYSHPNDELILRGISKTHMIQACYRLGVQVLEKPFTVDELKDADEIIVTSSSNFCLHACELDGAPAGGKDPDTLKAIQDAVIQEYFDYTGRTSIFDD